MSLRRRVAIIARVRVDNPGFYQSGGKIFCVAHGEPFYFLHEFFQLKIGQPEDISLYDSIRICHGEECGVFG